MTDPRIEEMTADQPADSRAQTVEAVRQRIVNVVDPTWDGLKVKQAALDACRAWLADHESATASPVPGLSVCVAQLAAIRQLAAKRVEMHAGTPLRPYVFVSDILAVLDGVPGTTQERIEEKT